MAKLYSTGPANLYVSVGVVGSSLTMRDFLIYPPKASIFFLGTCETKPNISIEPSFLPLKADIGGPLLPFDHLFTGEIAVVSGVVNKFNESVYAKITARPTLLGTRGAYTNKDIGQPMMMSGPGRAFSLWIQFPYTVAKPTVYGSGTGGWLQPKAYRFPGAILFGPDVVMPGTPSRRQLTFWCGRIYDNQSGAWLVYDHLTADPTDVFNSLPSVPPITVDGVLV